MDKKKLSEKEIERRAEIYKEIVRTLNALSVQYLLTDSDNYAKWFKYQNSHLSKFQREVKQFIAKEIKALKIAKNTPLEKGLVLSSVRMKKLNIQSEKMLNSIGTQAIKNQKKYINAMKLKRTLSFDNNAFQQALANVTRSVGTDGHEFVTYADGKKFRVEDYAAMKERTMRKEYTVKGAIENGSSVGQVFWICNYFGDCAKDHLEAQEQSIFWSKDWESICPDQYRAVVEAYITSHSNYMTIEEAMDERGGYFGLRPNCRHQFNAIAIEDVVTTDAREYQKDHNLEFKHEYDPEKVEHTKKQRYIERQLRKWKEPRDNQRAIVKALDKNADKELLKQEKAKLAQLNKRVTYYNNQMRDLINANDEMERERLREQY